ncbi:MAG: hypothetical protein ABI435_00340 [Pseudolysinimonas sp.]
MNATDDELDPILGEPPAPPVGLWDRVLQTAFDAPTLDHSDLVPIDVPVATDDVAFADELGGLGGHDNLHHVEVQPSAFDDVHSSHVETVIPDHHVDPGVDHAGF